MLCVWRFEFPSIQLVCTVEIDPPGRLGRPHPASDRVLTFSLLGMPTHRVKRVAFFGRTVPVLCQNENGPCPLLAICNALLLRGTIELPAGRKEMDTQELVQLVACRVLEANAGTLSSTDVGVAANAQKSVDDIIRILPGLQVGLDVNVRFGGVESFEFTRELAVFDLTGLRMLHGWTVDPDDKRSTAAVGKLSYNQLVEVLITLRSNLLEGKSSEGKATPQTGGQTPTTSGEVVITAELCEPDSKSPAEAMQEEAIILSTGNSSGNDDGELTCQVLDAVLVGGDGREPGMVGNSSVKEEQKQEGEKICQDGDSVSVGKVVSLHHSPDSAHSDSPLQFTNAAERGKGGACNDAERLAAIEDFLASTATQLSYHGLSQLHSHVKEREICVFFRNNHFNTMFKYEGHIYLLLTDLGYEMQPNYVWERLSQIDGDTMCCTSEFRRSPSVARPTASRDARLPQGNAHTAHMPDESGASLDFLLARQLQEEQEQREHRGGAQNEGTTVNRDGLIVASRESIEAQRAELDRLAAARRQQQGQGQGRASADQQPRGNKHAQRKKKKGGCTIC